MKAVPCVFGGLIQLLVVLGLVGLVAGNCGKPPPVPNAVPESKFLDISDFNDGSKVSYVCIPGYVRKKGSLQITCTGSTWSIPDLQCQKRDCGSPPELLNGRYETTEGTEFGASITAVCNEGYMLGGRDDSLSCGSDGMWSGGSPVCERVKCQDPPEIENGSREPESGIVSSSVVIYKCIPELDLIGNDMIVCGNDGEYNSQPPKCNRVSCRNIDVENGQKASGFGPQYRYKNSITFTCNMGFQLKGQSTITCDENSTWKPDPPTCVKASEVSCPIVDVENGQKTSGGSPPYRYKSSITFTCNMGFQLKGQSTITCDENGTWKPDPPTCVKAGGTVSPPTTTASPSGNKTGEIIGWTLGVIIGIIVIAVCAVAVKKCITKKNSSAKDNMVL